MNNKVVSIYLNIKSTVSNLILLLFLTLAILTLLNLIGVLDTTHSKFLDYTIIRKYFIRN